MKATDIEEAISLLAEQPFDAAEFPFRLLEAFGNKETTLRRLRSCTSNTSDVEGGRASAQQHSHRRLRSWRGQ